MTVRISDIIDAIEMTDQYTECFLDKETGQIERINDMVMMQEEEEEIYDRLDEYGFYGLPTSVDIRDYDIMEDFIETLSGKAHDILTSAINGRGAFRRFKDRLYDLGLEKQWYDFRADTYRRKAIKWCEVNNIEYTE